MNRKLLLSGFLFLALSAFGVPAKKGFRTIHQPDGTTLTVQMVGDEHFHYYTSSDGVMLKKDDDGFFKYAVEENGMIKASELIAKNPDQRSDTDKRFITNIDANELNTTLQRTRRSKVITRNASISKSAAFPSTGEVHGLVLLVQFQDVKFTIDKPLESFINHTNQENYSKDGASGSVRDYFMAQSAGKFTPKFDVYGPITVNSKMAVYGKNDTNGDDADPTRMVKEACELAAKNFGVDFSKYDIDNDGTVDLVYVVFAGYGESQCDDPNTVWPHAWDIAGGGYYLNLNGKNIRSYACSSELSGGSGKNMDGIGTFCHEFSHCLGLPDLYQTNYEYTNFGMGEWDIMDAGSYNNYSKTPAAYSAFEKASVGWLTLKELTVPQKITLPELHASDEAYVVYSDQNRNEYFIFENRQEAGWDTYLPASGLMITHIDYLQSAWDNNTVNDVAGHQRVSLIPADNELVIYDEENGTNYFNSLLGDLYPGPKKNTSFTDTSKPAATLYSGGKLGKPITNITHVNKVVSFDFMEGLVQAPQTLPASDISATGFTANWTGVDGANSYSLKVTEVVSGETILEEDFNKFTEGSIASAHSMDIGSKLDYYMKQAGWKGSKIFQAGKVCKMGSNSGNGELISPALDLSSANGTVTLYYTLHGKSALSQAARFALCSDNSGENELQKIIRDVPAASSRKCVVFTNVPANAYLKISLLCVSYLDDIALYSGDVSDNEPKIGTRTTQTFPLIIENITGTSCPVSGLTPETTYAYSVMTVTSTGQSAWSTPVTVSTPTATGLNNSLVTSQIRVDGNQLTLCGNAGKQVTVCHISGTVLYSAVLSDNQTTITCSKGVYVVRIGSETVKVLIGE